MYENTILNTILNMDDNIKYLKIHGISSHLSNI